MSDQAKLYLITPVIEDFAAFGPLLSAAIDGHAPACVLLRLAARGDAEAKKALRTLAPLVQTPGAALLLDGAVPLAARVNADGVHIRGPGAVLDDALASLKPERIVGAGALRNKDDAMSAGETGVDYVMFGEPAPDGYTPALAATLERVEWWAQIFNVPCIGFAAQLDDIGPLVEAGADFVALGEAVWGDPRGPAEAMREAAVALADARSPA